MTSAPVRSFTLTPEQQVGADELFAFLLSPDKEHRISGPGGVGKTYFMQYVVYELMPRYIETCKIMGIDPLYDDIEITATTNKAAEELYNATGLPAQTIYSYLGLKVVPDGKGGNKLIRGRNWSAKTRTIIFVDESSMLGRDGLAEIRGSTVGCKIIYVGDHCQLGPIKEEVSQVYLDPMGTTHFTQPMRNKGQPALIDLCLQARTTVETGEFKPIQIVPGIIDLLDEQQWVDEISKNFTQQNMTDRILCYTNNRVLDYNDHIRTLRSLPNLFTVGEVLVNNSMVQLKDRMIPVEKQVIVFAASPNVTKVALADGYELDVQKLTLEYNGDVVDVEAPTNREHYNDLVKHFRAVGKRTGDWSTYYQLTERYPDLRQRDGATVHKAQGATHDTVYIDLNDLSTCHQPKTFVRLFYVGVSRARNRIAFHGTLPDKYGGLII